MSIMSVTSKGFAVGLIMCLCASCDRGVQLIPRGSANFAWSDCERPSMFDTHVDAHSCRVGNQLWTILRWKGYGQLAGEDRIVLLCTRDRIDEGLPVCELDQGIVVCTWGFARDPEVEGDINRLRILDNKHFQGEVCSGRIRLLYDGRVSGKSNYDDGSDHHYLRFQVRPKKNRQKVFSIVKGLYPLLEQEKDAQGLIGCLAPLLEEQDD